MRSLCACQLPDPFDGSKVFKPSQVEGTIQYVDMNRTRFVDPRFGWERVPTWEERGVGHKDVRYVVGRMRWSEWHGKCPACGEDHVAIGERVYEPEHPIMVKINRDEAIARARAGAT